MIQMATIKVECGCGTITKPLPIDANNHVVNPNLLCVKCGNACSVTFVEKQETRAERKARQKSEKALAKAEDK